MELESDKPQSPPSAPAGASPRGSSTLSLRWPTLSGLRAKLILPYALLTLLTAMVGIYVVTRLVTASVRERFINQLNEASQVAGDQIVRRERTQLANLRLLAFTQGVPEAMVGHDPATLQNLLYPLTLNNNIEIVIAVDLKGSEIASLTRNPATGEYITGRGRDFSGEELVTAILTGQSDTVGDKFAGLVEIAQVPYLMTDAPVLDANGKLAGVLLLGTRLATVLSEIKTQALADVIVLNPNGELVATTLVEPDQGYGVLELTPEEVTGLDTLGTRDLNLYNRDYQAVYAPLVVRQKTLGVLGVVLPSNYVVATEATSRNSFSLIFTLATAAVVLIGYFLSQSIAQPILRLRAMSQAVAAGSLDQRMGLQQSDEIGELAAAFDTMTLRLRERTAEAARLYAETVQRNRELAEINARLQSTQQQLIQSEKLAAVGQLTAGIVHDVKNPLAIVKGLAELLAEDEKDDDTRKQLTSIRDNVARANRIVSDLLTFARQSEVQIRERDLKATVETALRLTAYLVKAAHISVVTDLPDRPVMVACDGQQIEQVLINLIQNAIQAMPNRGTLRINLSQADEAVAIAVQDTGVGIPPEHLRRVFDPFFTTKPEGEGTGLGLSVSYGIIANHNGRIDVESIPGQGTTFTILLPVKQPAERPPQEEPV